MDAFPDRLQDFVYIPDTDAKFENLKSLAEPEDWGYRISAEPRPNPVLFSYVVFTYRRLAEERKIEYSEDRAQLCFNTGLVTKNHEEIFLLASANKLQGKQPWFFSGWHKRSANELRGFSHLPDIAEYFTDPSVLVFDLRLDFRPNVDHIIADNRDRFPEPFRSLPDFALTSLLDGAITKTKTRLKRNYKTAIPQYFNGRMQLLLPLSLGNPNKADLALAVENRNGHYRAATCLTLDMAYNNARQLARPDKDWLNP